VSVTTDPPGARIGLGMVEFPFQNVRRLWQWVDLCEAGGIDAIWHCDRLIAREPYMEVMTFLAALAGRTERLRLGMDVVVVPFRDPLVLAKQCATIDYLSQGRLCPGFGVGPATVPEWSATGRHTTARGARTDEALQLMQRLWSGEPVTHDGKFFHYQDATITPTPVQQPLPLWIGGRSDAAVQRIARLGSGWFSGLATPAQVAPVIEAIRRACDAAGRPFPAENYGADFAVHIGDADDPAVQASIASMRGFTDQAPENLIAVGSVAHIRRRIDAFRAVGVRTFALRPLASTDAGLLDQTRRIIDEIVPFYATTTDT
jgi:probable F420-dependent oxidoreductase